MHRWSVWDPPACCRAEKETSGDFCGGDQAGSARSCPWRGGCWDLSERPAAQMGHRPMRRTKKKHQLDVLHSSPCSLHRVILQPSYLFFSGWPLTLTFLLEILENRFPSAQVCCCCFLFSMEEYMSKTASSFRQGTSFHCLCMKELTCDWTLYKQTQYESEE